MNPHIDAINEWMRDHISREPDRWITEKLHSQQVPDGVILFVHSEGAGVADLRVGCEDDLDLPRILIEEEGCRPLRGVHLIEVEKKRNLSEEARR